MDERKVKWLKADDSRSDGVTVWRWMANRSGRRECALARKVKSLVAEGKKKSCCMDNITFIDSAALEHSCSHHSAKPGRIAPSLPPGRQIYGSPANHELMTIFDVSYTEAEAVASFSSKLHRFSTCREFSKGRLTPVFLFLIRARYIVIRSAAWDRSPWTSAASLRRGRHPHHQIHFHGFSRKRLRLPRSTAAMPSRLRARRSVGFRRHGCAVIPSAGSRMPLVQQHYIQLPLQRDIPGSTCVISASPERQHIEGALAHRPRVTPIACWGLPPPGTPGLLLRFMRCASVANENTSVANRAPGSGAPRSRKSPAAGTTRCVGRIVNPSLSVL